MARRFTDQAIAGALRLAAANMRGEIETPAYRKRHQHEPEYLEHRAEHIEMIDEAVSLFEASVARKAAK